jgi:hypothetical protein
LNGHFRLADYAGGDFFNMAWRQISEVNFRMEVNSFGELNMKVNFGGEFQYAGEFRG